MQPRAQGSGVGALLIREAERVAWQATLPALWLTVRDANANALAFYARMGYAEVGTTTYTFEDRAYRNRVFARTASPR
ncbi:MAG: GNAT family N-acetyltransferase [Burkholderiales bacterium]|nr:GNAT family N-acetyltransferase [Burkholderiales bacterium]